MAARGFVMSGYWILPDFFLPLSIRSCDITFSSRSMWWITLIDFWMPNQLCISGVNLPWPRYAVTFGFHNVPVFRWVSVPGRCRLQFSGVFRLASGWHWPHRTSFREYLVCSLDGNGWRRFGIISLLKVSWNSPVNSLGLLLSVGEGYPLLIQFFK